jgi:hypothetical protein
LFIHLQYHCWNRGNSIAFIPGHPFDDRKLRCFRRKRRDRITIFRDPGVKVNESGDAFMQLVRDPTDDHSSVGVAT